jgi:hypothetical protein
MHAHEQARCHFLWSFQYVLDIKHQKKTLGVKGIFTERKHTSSVFL